MTENAAAGSARKAAPSRTKPPEVRLDELMGAAQALFLEKGVEATTISEITEAAGVAKGTFYVYFPSKQEMLAALGQRYAREFVEQLERAVEACAEDDWVGRLRAWILANVATYLRTYRVHDIVFTHPHHHAREGHTENLVVRQLQGILEAGAAAGAGSPAHAAGPWNSANGRGVPAGESAGESAAGSAPPGAASPPSRARACSKNEAGPRFIISSTSLSGFFCESRAPRVG